MGIPRHVALAPAAALLAVTVACSGGSSEDPETLLKEAQGTLDTTAGLHFELTSSNTPSGGVVLTGGSGDVVRPNQFQGTLHVDRSGLAASVDVISTDGTVYVKLPLLPGYHETDPHSFGFSDPGLLLDPDTGLSSLISQATDVKSVGKARVNGDEVEEIEVTIPGAAVGQVLADADPDKPVTARLGITPDTHELRRAVLTGPLLDADTESTFTVVLDHYGETVDINAP